MPVRFRRVSSVLASAIACAAVAACTLDVAGLGAPLAKATPDASAQPDAQSLVAPDADADDASVADAALDASSEASVAIDAGPDVDAGDPCDQDGDGHRAMGSVCLGDDCCDTDPNTHPGQTSYFATRNACSSFDYDCNNVEEAEQGTAACKLGFFDCSGNGFAAPTACGVTAMYTTCAYAGFGCNQNEDMRAQRCR
jgi:hypothetical protein